MKGPSNARLQEIAVDYIAAIENLKKAESLWWYSVENDFEEQFGLAVSGSIEAANRLTNSGDDISDPAWRGRVKEFETRLRDAEERAIQLQYYYEQNKSTDDLRITSLFKTAISTFSKGLIETIAGDVSILDKAINLEAYLGRRNIWWLQSRPSYWRVEDFKVGDFQEYSTHNHDGNKRRTFEFFFEAKIGELMLIYEASPSMCIKALAEVTKEVKRNEKRGLLEFKIIYFFKNQTSWQVLKALSVFSRSQIVENNQGSIYKLTKEEFLEIIGTTELNLNTPTGGSSIVPSIINTLKRTAIDNDGAFAKEDLLGYTKDIRAFASLIALKELKPPLAIALFGHWGTGKSFFMHHLRLSVDSLSKNQGFAAQAGEEQTGEKEKVFCEGIVQIEFNAWSYLDANLWAGLVSTIFEKLDDYIKGNVLEEDEEKVQKELNDRLKIASEQKKKIQEEKDQLDSKKVKVEQQITDEEDRKKILLREIEAKSLEDIKGEVRRIIQPRIDTLRDQLTGYGITEDSLTKVSPNALYEEVKSWVTFGRNLLKFNMASRVLFVGFFLLFAFFIWDPFHWIASHLDQIQRGSAIIISFVAPILVKWLNTFSKYKELLNPVISLKNNFNDRVESAEFEHQNKLVVLKTELVENDVKLKELNDTLKTIDKDIAQVEYSLKHTVTKQAFFNFISRKSGSESYEKHLGLISTVRKDFETLSKLFSQSNEGIQDESDTKEFLGLFSKPLDRIILYIDDLDRCPDDKVMEVLQAVHLLMAFPLFIVVTGVDKRCVQNALTHRNLLQYSSFSKNGDLEELKKLGINIIRPSEYLEKIFQIPFHLEEAEEKSISRMVASLLENHVEKEERATDLDKQISEAFKTIDQGQGLGQLKFRDDIGPNVLRMEIQEEKNAEGKEAVKYITPENLKISSFEYQSLQEIAWLVGNTPRTIKRFINIYRIVRTHELLSYREDEKNETFLAIMFVLSVSIGRFREAGADLVKNFSTSPQTAFKDLSFPPDSKQELIKNRLREGTNLPLLLEIKGEKFGHIYPLARRFSFEAI
jgi:hypothetical protein